MNVEPPGTLVIIESIVYKSNGFAIFELIMGNWDEAGKRKKHLSVYL